MDDDDAKPDDHSIRHHDTRQHGAWEMTKVKAPGVVKRCGAS